MRRSVRLLCVEVKNGGGPFRNAGERCNTRGLEKLESQEKKKNSHNTQTTTHCQVHTSALTTPSRPLASPAQCLAPAPKQRDSTPQVNWTNLPPEIWTLIFRQATLVPYLISPDLCNYGKSNPFARKQRESFKQSLVTKRCLIRLGRGRVLASLCEALKRSHRISTDIAPEEIPLGWWTKRIDVVMRDSTNDPSRDMALVGNIVAMSPNLSILLFDITCNRYGPHLGHIGAFPSSILRYACPENLTMMYCYNERGGVQAEDWIQFMVSHFPSISNVSPKSFAAGPHRLPTVPDFPHLTSLHLYHPWTFDYFGYLELPNLQHLRYHSTDHLLDEHWSPEPFLRKHGTKLKSLMMDKCIPGNLLDLFSKTCPNLINLELSTVDSWLDGDVSTLPPVSLITLGDSGFRKAWELQFLFDFVVKAKAMCHTLITVRLCNERTVSALHTHPRLLQDQLGVLSAVGVALEDSEGMPLNPS